MSEEDQRLDRILPGEEYRLVLVTAPNEAVAAQLARGLVEQGLAACVNRIPGVMSTYRWEAQLQDEPEVLLLIKTRAPKLEALAAFLVEQHPYDVPECIALGISEVERAYAQWMGEALA